MSWFDSEKAKIRKSHIKNLITLALTDGNVDKSEQEFLFSIAAQWGLEPKEFQDILKNPQKVKFNPPKTREESAQQLLDLIYMMMIDGKIRESEMDLCKTMAPGLGYPPSVVDKVVNTIVDGINKEIERDILVHQVASMN